MLRGEVLADGSNKFTHLETECTGFDKYFDTQTGEFKKTLARDVIFHAEDGELEKHQDYYVLAIDATTLLNQTFYLKNRHGKYEEFSTQDYPKLYIKAARAITTNSPASLFGNALGSGWTKDQDLMHALQHDQYQLESRIGSLNSKNLTGFAYSVYEKNKGPQDLRAVGIAAVIAAVILTGIVLPAVLMLCLIKPQAKRIVEEKPKSNFYFI